MLCIRSLQVSNFANLNRIFAALAMLFIACSVDSCGSSGDSSDSGMGEGAALEYRVK